MFCPTCRDEFREGFSWCPDCEVALVETLPEEPEEAEEGWDEEEVLDWQDEEGEQSQDAADLASTPETRLRARELLLVLFVSYGTSIVDSILARLKGVVYSSDYSSGNSIFRIVNATACLALLGYVLGRRGRTLRDLGLTPKRADVLPTIFMTVAAFASALLPVAIRYGPSYASDLLHRHGIWHSSGPLLWLAFLISAAKEELIVRAYMITEVVDLTGQAALAVLASACFQSLYHLYQGPGAALFHLPMFLVFSLYYLKYRRATPLVLAHFLYDLLI